MSEFVARVGIGIAGRGQADSQGNQAIGVEPPIDGLKLDETSRHQRGADEQHDRERDFADDQCAPETPRALRSGDRPRVALEGVRDAGARRQPGWRQAEERGRNETDEGGEQNRPRVEINGVHARLPEHLRHHLKGQLQHEPGDREAGDGPDGADQQMLHERLPHEITSRGTQGRPDGVVPRARERARQRQVREVGADNQQQECHGAPEHEERQPEFFLDQLT